MAFARMTYTGRNVTPNSPEAFGATLTDVPYRQRRGTVLGMMDRLGSTRHTTAEIYTKLQLTRYLLVKLGYEVLQGRATLSAGLTL
ncbi:hypothetical protein ABPG75_000075 [Micractinium tetrahymenae]